MSDERIDWSRAALAPTRDVVTGDYARGKDLSRAALEPIPASKLAEAVRRLWLGWWLR